jgi:hypothetical protein
MATSVKLQYQVEAAGASGAKLQALMEAVPVPQDLLKAAGLFVFNDHTSAGPVVTRTIEIAFGPTSPAAATAVLSNQESVASVMVTAPGIDYIVPPPVVFTPVFADDQIVTKVRPALAKAFMNVQDVNLVSGGTGFSPSTFAVVTGGMGVPAYLPTPFTPNATAPNDFSPQFQPGNVLPFSCVQDVRISVEGKGYTLGAQIQFNGGLDLELFGGVDISGASPAKAIITKLGPRGQILAVQLTDPGSHYVGVPKIIVNDRAHKGGGFMITRPNPITGKTLNPNMVGNRFGDATPSNLDYIAANLSPIMGQGSPATIKLTITAGVITGAAIDHFGERYISVPTITVIDPTGAGSGAVLTPRMGIGTIERISGGKGYPVPPTVSLPSFFKTIFPTDAAQIQPFGKLMQSALQAACLSPVTSLDPVLT